MAENKKAQLSIVLRTVDQATARINAIAKRLDAVTKPIRDFKKALGDLREKSGLDAVIGGFKGVGSAIAGVLAKVAMIGGVAGAAVVGLLSLVDGFAQLGDKAEALGVGVDYLAQLRHAAEKSGSSADKLDAGLANLSKNMGMLRANGGPLVQFLGTVSPTLLKQVKATKSTEEAFDLLAGAMAKIEDPAKRAAFAAKTLGDAGLAPLLSKGPKGIQALRDEFLDLGGSQEEAVKASADLDASMKELKASTTGIKAALVSGLAPALKVIVEQLRDWFKENRANVAEWAASLGKKLPGAFKSLVGAVRGIINAVRPFVDSSTKLKLVAVALAGIIMGPLISSIVSLGIAIMTTPVGWILAGIAAIAAAGYMLIKHWDEVKAFFAGIWDWLVDKFGWGASLIATLLLPFTGAAALISASWGSIKEFFSNLWDGIVAAFKKSIEWIVKKIEWIFGKIKAAKDWLTGDDDAEAKELYQAEAAMRAPFALHKREENQARLDRARQAYDESRTGAVINKLIVDFNNAPKGTRVTADPQSSDEIETSVTNQLWAP